MCTCDCALNIGVGGFTPRLTALELPSVVPCAYCVHTVAYILISSLLSFYSNHTSLDLGLGIFEEAE
jgi:hypothetical protein